MPGWCWRNIEANLQHEISVLKAALLERPKCDLTMISGMISSLEIIQEYRPTTVLYLWLIVSNQKPEQWELGRKAALVQLRSNMPHNASVVYLLLINCFQFWFNFGLHFLSLMSVEDSKSLRQLTVACSLHGYVFCLKSFVRCFHFRHMNKFHSGYLETFS